MKKKIAGEETRREEKKNAHIILSNGNNSLGLIRFGVYKKKTHSSNIIYMNAVHII